MNRKIYSIRSDFADEVNVNEDKQATYSHFEKTIGNIKTNYIEVLEEDNALGKEVGDYVSIEFDNLFDRMHRDEVVDVVIHHMQTMLQHMKLKKMEKILVVGLGNRFITSDALGPGCANEIMVTAHLYANDEKEMMRGTRNVAVISPGVMGQTGIESAEIVMNIVNGYQPDLVIAIDALATKNTRRINRVIQINNTGIRPGSGVGNHRLALNEETLHIPVIAIGVATVTSIGAILSESLSQLDVDECDQILQQVQDQNALDLVVTPKSMDDELQHLIYMVSRSLNEVLHPDYLSL